MMPNSKNNSSDPKNSADSKSNDSASKNHAADSKNNHADQKNHTSASKNHADLTKSSSTCRKDNIEWKNRIDSINNADAPPLQVNSKCSSSSYIQLSIVIQLPGRCFVKKWQWALYFTLMFVGIWWTFCCREMVVVVTSPLRQGQLNHWRTKVLVVATRFSPPFLLKLL